MNIKKCGLFVDREYPYLVATSVGLVREDTVVEVKCPENSKDLTPFEGIQKKRIACCEEVEIGNARAGTIALKKSSKPLVPGSRASTHHRAETRSAQGKESAHAQY